MTGGMTARPTDYRVLATEFRWRGNGAHHEARFRSDSRRRAAMAVPLTLGPVHHLRLTVTDVERSRVFDTELRAGQRPLRPLPLRP
jgi:hypothetical protein